MPLCEAYLGIDPHYDLQNYFFRIRHPQDTDMQLIIGGGAWLFMPSLGMTSIPISTSHAQIYEGVAVEVVLPETNSDAPLPTFTGNHPIPLLTYGYGVSRKDLSKLQPLREVIQ
jgi:hypothetical protein